ncbi:MAG: VOC family protein [Amphiplicatus sp.]
MIIGAHSILYSSDAEKDRAFLRDVLKLPSVDSGDGFLIFGLPPAEIAMHPGAPETPAEFYLMCADIEAFAAAMAAEGLACGPRESRDWGVLARLALPSGAPLNVYEPAHKRPKPAKAGKSIGKKAKAAKKTAKAKKPKKAEKPKKPKKKRK